MLTVRVLPRRAALARSALATVEITSALVLAHTAAGGTLPSVPWIAAMALAVLAAGVPVLGGRVTARVAVPALVVVQLLMHCYLAVLTPGPSGSMPGMAMDVDGGPLHTLLGSLTPAMVGAHLVGALVTALVWELRSRAADVLVTWSESGPAPLPCRAEARRRQRRPAAPVAARFVTVAPRRGPPTVPLRA